MLGVRQLCLDSKVPSWVEKIWRSILQTMSFVEAQRAWYCIRSTVGYEGRAAELLSRLSPDTELSTGKIEVFCPQIRKVIPVGGKRRAVLIPLFPGYFFSQFCLATAGRFIASRPGIIGLVRFGDEPTVVPADVIEEMQATDFVAAAELALSSYSFVPGQRLVIREGPFAGMEAEYVASLNDGQRALLLLEYLHRRVNVVADSEILERVA